MLEVGFGPGVVIQRLAKLAVAVTLQALINPERWSSRLAPRNATAVREGRVELRHGSVESLPFDDRSFDRALAMNSMQYWPQAVVALQEVRRGGVDRHYCSKAVAVDYFPVE